MVPITSKAPSNPILTRSSSTPFRNNISSGFSSLSSLSATCKAGTHFHVTSRLRLHLLKFFHGPISGYYFTKHGDLRLQECYQPDIGYMHRTGEKFHSLATCAKAGCVTCQPCDDATQFIRSSNAAQRIQIRPFLKEVGLRIEIRCRHT